MWIECSNPATRRLGIDGEFAEFDADGRSRVTKSLGEKLSDQLPAVSIAEREGDNSESEGGS